MTNVLLLSPYADALLPTFKRAGDKVVVMLSPEALEWAAPADDQPDFIVMYGWPQILMDDWYWQTFPGRIINLHLSLLPHNRGADPNFWSWRDDTLKGVTIHQVVGKGVDTGPVLVAAVASAWENHHTLASSYKELSATLEGLFAHYWTQIRDGKIGPRAQGPDGSVHRKADLDPFRYALKDWSLPCSEVAALEPRP